MPQLPPRPKTTKVSSSSADDINLLQEIDDTLRAERMAQIWKDFGGIIVAASVAILLATVGWVIWKNHVAAENLDSTSQLIQAQALENQSKFSDAAEQYARIGVGSSSKQQLAALYEADAWMRAGQNEKAQTVLKNIIAGNSGSEGFKELARLKLGAMQAESGDTKMLDEAAAADKPFSYTAREIKAVKLSAGGKEADAQAIFKTLSEDKQAPFTLKQRVASAAGVSGASADVPPAVVPAP